MSCVRVLLCNSEILLFKNCLLRIITMYLMVKYGAGSVLSQEQYLWRWREGTTPNMMLSLYK